MSLLDKGPETLIVYPTIQVDDGYGGTKPAPGPPQTIRAQVTPATSEEAGDGYLTSTEYQVRGRSLPAGPWSQVDWAGDTWAVVGEVRHFHQSARMRFDQATIRKRGT